MHRTQRRQREARCFRRKQGLRTLIRVPLLSRRAKRRSCRLHWRWRRSFSFRKKRLLGVGSALAVNTRSQKHRGGDAGCSEECFPPRLRQSEALVAAGSSQGLGTDAHVWSGDGDAVAPTRGTPGAGAHGFSSRSREPRTPADRRAEVNVPSGPRGPQQNVNMNSDRRADRKHAAPGPADAEVLAKDVHEFLDGFYRRYGSFFPLQQRDALKHLKKKFNADASDWKNLVFSEVSKRQTASAQRPAPSFQVVYRKHTLTLDDLSTLAEQNWLNDQVINMYGELIMDSVDGKVHFLSSFFHRQLMTKGYDGVKRWTKKVDLFSKALLLVPIHLEVHWCLVTADSDQKKICLYDSQGNALQKVARNILKYLTAEAKEKKRAAFASGWAVSCDEKIPQQTNENDCGVFVLEYSRCLALGKPLQFSQKDIPKIRKRIYKELCDCRLHEQG